VSVGRSSGGMAGDAWIARGVIETPRIGSLVLLVIGFVAGSASAITLSTGDRLSVTFSDADGAVTSVSVGGLPVALIVGEPGGWSVRVGNPISPFVVQHSDFDAGAGSVVSARNAYWDDYGSYVSWVSDGGIDDSGHLLLGDGSTEGAGMAMALPVAVGAAGKLKISWWARSASTETTHILCVRIYDAQGQDITSSSNTPSGWSYTGTSLAHGVWGFGCSQADTWEYFERTYGVSTDAAYVRVSLRHWTGGDHLLHVDDFHLDAVGGIEWGERVAVAGPVVPIDDAFSQSVDVVGMDLHVDTTMRAVGGYIETEAALQDLSAPLTDRAIQLDWTLPVKALRKRWWDDIDTWRPITMGTLYRNTFDHNRHPISYYPFSSISGSEFGLSLAVPQEVPTPQRFEYDADVGLSSVWEIGLSPVTVKLGPGHATVAATLYGHDPAWGFRAAAQRYYERFPEYFEKRTTREGAWLYPIHPSQIPDPLDFGFAFHETNPVSDAELDLCHQLGIGVFYYTTPWDVWQPWGDDPDKPPYEERVARLEEWAATDQWLIEWQPDGGIDGSGHLLLGDGVSTGAGMATASPFAVQPGQPVRISWQAKVADVETTQILCVRLFDGQGNDITQATPAPSGWFYSGASEAHVIAGIANASLDVWEPFVYDYSVPADAAQMRLSLRHWNGGDHWVHIDDLRVEDISGQTVWLALDFDADGGPWVSAQNDNWENAGPIWLRVPRQTTAQAVINSSPLDAAGRYFIDSHSYLWHEWGSDGNWFQAWPVNPDPDLPSPNTFELHREHWIHYDLDNTDGVYIDSVTTGSISGWENRRPDHLAVADWPLTFSWDDGRAAQIAPQAHEEFFAVISDEVRSLGKAMMLNIFPKAMRFHSHQGDVLGSEISQLVESDANSRLRRTLARHRVVSNLLQWGWDQPTYATYEQMEEFIRGQLFWGFYPAVSSAGGMMNGASPDRYFLHPELYERDRPLFQHYMPVIQSLSAAGWEPVTYATATGQADIERFGSADQGVVFLTVRGSDGAALQSEVTLDLAACGAGGACSLADARDVLLDQPLPAAFHISPARVSFAVSLGAGEVGVYQFVVDPYAPGDVDQDGDVDLGDYGDFLSCYNGPNAPPPVPACDTLDLDRDGDVDLSDYGIFLTCYNGPQNPPACW
jgi:hypothetical protein